MLITIIVCVSCVSIARAQDPTPVPNGTAITLMEHPESSTLDVNLQCAESSCDAVSLEITFNPTAVQVLILSQGDFWRSTTNQVHILREEVDNQLGRVEFMYVTENQGGMLVSGTGTLLSLAVIPLTEAPPEFRLVWAEIASITGETVFRSLSQTPLPLLSTPISESRTVVINVQTESGSPTNVTAQAMDTSELSIVLEPMTNNQAPFEFTMSATASSHLVVFRSPAHLPCFLDVANIASMTTVILRAGDVNSDGIIDINDTALVGSSIRTGQTLVDINRDNRIDILDLIHIGRNYGQQTGMCTS